jgi:predicted nucleotidyltransferase
VLNVHIIATVNQKVLSLLAKFSDKEFYERQIARKIDIGYGSANHALNELYSTGTIKRRQEGKMYFYSIDPSNAAIIEFKKLINIVLIETLIEELKDVSSRIVLYGSCAQGIDTSQSDLDLFIVSNDKERVMDAIGSFSFPRGFEDIHIQPVIKSPVELLEAGESEQAFIEEVEHGIALWERATNGPRL